METPKDKKTRYWCNSPDSDNDLDVSSTEEYWFESPKKRKYRRAIFQEEQTHSKPHLTTHLLQNSTNDDLTPEQIPQGEYASSSASVFSADIYTCNNESTMSRSSSDISLTGSENSLSFSDGTCSNISLSGIDSDKSVYSESDNEEDEEDEENINFDDSELKDEHLYDGSAHTVISAYVSIMLFVMKHCLTKEAFTDLLFLLISFMPKPCKLTTSVYKLKEYLKRKMDIKEPIKHFICDICGTLLAEGENCRKDDCRTMQAKTKEFYDLRLEKQIEELFKDERICKLIFEKEPPSDQQDQFTDICDGSEYQRIQNIPKISQSEKNITFTMNTDGVALFSSSNKGSLWPVYLAVNELPVKLRYSKKYLLTTHLYCQPEKPNMLAYLSPLMKTLRQLHAEGMKITTAYGEMLLRCHLLAVSVDLPAKAAVLNAKQFNGKFGCSYCLDEGKNPPNRPMLRYYPYVEDSVARSHKCMLEDARIAVNTGQPIHGIKGATALIALQYIDLPRTFVIDWMHAVLLGVVKTILTLWCDPVYKGNSYYIGDKQALVNQRLLSIKVPDYITRQQRKLEDYKHWKATECKDWLLHYSVPIMTGIQELEIMIHYSLLVTAMYLLNKQSVSRDEIGKAEKCLMDFCRLFPDYYVLSKQTMNIHLLKHMPEFVKSHGPIFHYSCFGFESMNSHLKNMVHGTRFINSQICFAVGMAKCLPDLVKMISNNAELDVKLLIHRLSSKLMISDEFENGRIKPLGARNLHKMTTKEKALFIDQSQAVYKYYRAETNIGVIYSEQYRRTSNRNSYSVMYLDDQQTTKFGSVKYFLQTEPSLFAVIDQFQLMPKSLFSFSDVRNQFLLAYKDFNLCPQIVQLQEQQIENLTLVPVENIQFKCVFMACQRNRKLLSIPPNIMEHN